MKSFKVNENLLGLLLVGAMFAGWEYLIVVTAFSLVFCDISEKFKDLVVKVLAVFIAISLILLLWDLVLEGKEVIFGGLRSFFELLVSWGVDSDLLYNFDKYFMNIINFIFNIAGDVLVFIVLAIKVRFIFSVLNNKEMSSVFGPVQSFINKSLAFAKNNFYK